MKNRPFFTGAHESVLMADKSLKLPSRLAAGIEPESELIIVPREDHFLIIPKDEYALGELGLAATPHEIVQLRPGYDCQISISTTPVLKAGETILYLGAIDRILVYAKEDYEKTNKLNQGAFLESLRKQSGSRDRSE